MIVAPWRKTGDGRTPAFADIFKSNAVKNGLLTIALSEQEVDRLILLVKENERLEATVDLPGQEITVHAPDKQEFCFDMDVGSKERLLKAWMISPSVWHTRRISPPSSPPMNQFIGR